MNHFYNKNMIKKIFLGFKKGQNPSDDAKKYQYHNYTFY